MQLLTEDYKIWKFGSNTFYGLCNENKRKLYKGSSRLEVVGKMLQDIYEMAYAK